MEETNEKRLDDSAAGLESTAAEPQGITGELDTAGASEAPTDTVNQPPEAAVEHTKVLPLHLLGSPALRRDTHIITEINDDIRALAKIMTDTMFHVNGVGLAAPQIGLSIRLFVMVHQAESKVLRLANPVINSSEGEQEIDEGCLSQPMLSVKMKRPKYIAVSALDIDSGQQVIIEGTDLEAAILSHEMDHLNGKLLVDYLSRLKRDMYKKKLAKKVKQFDRAEAAKRRLLEGAAKAKDQRDHPHYHEPHK